MKISFFVFLCLSFASPLFAEGPHNHASSGEKAMKLNSGKKWETDAPLRAGMAGIRDSLAPLTGAIHSGKATMAQYSELAGKISEHTDSIFKNCKLAPKADAQLHLVLADILDGTSKMKSAETIQDRRGGAVKIVGALQQYPKFFDHPGWHPLTH